jgi:hypothetical protein
MSWLDRQSFLGANSEQRLAEMTVGLVGLGGGNSHVAQQLAHAGVGHFVLADADHVSLTNLNRLIGGTWWYVLKRTAKVMIMKRMILAINPKARVEIHCEQWQLVGDALKHCEVIVGGLDNVRGKDELDAFCRRFLIPYVDQGMDVHKLRGGHGHLVAGQVVLSEPGARACVAWESLPTPRWLKNHANMVPPAGVHRWCGRTACSPRWRSDWSCSWSPPGVAGPSQVPIWRTTAIPVWSPRLNDFGVGRRPARITRMWPLAT